MSVRCWFLIAGISGAVAVLFGAYAEHGLNGGAAIENGPRALLLAEVYHLVHTAALFGIATLLTATEGRRSPMVGALVQLAGVAFLLGIFAFVGGVYSHIYTGVRTPSPIVPMGGTSFAIGWLLLAIAAFGFQTTKQK